MKNHLQKTLLTILALSLLTAVGGSLIGVQDASALVDTPWGPKRKTFTWKDPAPYATFNSITDNPGVGDERNFVQMREISQQYYQDEVTLKAGKTYEVYIYYHNNADGHEVGKTAIGIADGASVKSSFPATVKKGKRATITATIFASDTDPLEVWDGVYMNPTEDLYLRYIPGTATIHNGGKLNGQNIGPDYLFGDGALLGYNKFSGILPGCNEYAGYITYRLYADAPGFKITKSIVGDTTTVNPGDTVTFKVRYENTGTMDQTNVVVKDNLPEGLEYVPGSAKLYNNNLTGGKSVNDDIIAENGMNIGNYAGGSGWAEVTYQAVAKEGLTCGSVLTNKVIVSTDDGNKEAEVSVKVSGDSCVEPDCTTNPDLPECQPTEEDCKNNPDLPGCQPTEEDCKNNPNLPGCQPTEENCKTNPELEGCKELPNTGPLEIVMAIIIIAGIGGGGYYLYRTKRTLKTAENVAKGEEKPVSDAAKEEKQVEKTEKK
ncbi:DUF11 domain-containing protein [Candidatus Saccharibacteria bacterium]|nr:DUF11 domain-containing protein [Candidatus Saccharibacteria bacterium]